MEIRPFQSADESAVVELWRVCDLLRPWNDPRADIARKLRVQPELFLVGLINNQPVATAMGGYEGHRGWVNYLAVEPARRRQGLGREILAALEMRLRAIGCPKINLQIRASNTAAVGFYEAIGYRPDEVCSFGKRLVDDERTNLSSSAAPDQSTSAKSPPAIEIDILTLFPELCEGAFRASMLGRAQEAGRAAIRVHNLRNWARDKHRTTDDVPFGGGQGMVLKPEPIFEAVEALRREGSRVILLSPQGAVFRQAAAERLAAAGHLIFICGQYEGVDARVGEFLCDEEISLGDYVLTNGAIAAAVVVDAVVRLVPGVLGHDQSATQDSFSVAHGGLLEGPQYTRPAMFREHAVPAVLLSGNHANIARWRVEQGRKLTREVRPDLLA